MQLNIEMMLIWDTIDWCVTELFNENQFLS